MYQFCLHLIVLKKYKFRFEELTKIIENVLVVQYLVTQKKELFNK